MGLKWVEMSALIASLKRNFASNSTVCPHRGFRHLVSSQQHGNAHERLTLAEDPQGDRQGGWVWLGLRPGDGGGFGSVGHGAVGTLAEPHDHIRIERGGGRGKVPGFGNLWDRQQQVSATA